MIEKTDSISLALATIAVLGQAPRADGLGSAQSPTRSVAESELTRPFQPARDEAAGLPEQPIARIFTSGHVAYRNPKLMPKILIVDDSRTELEFARNILIQNAFTTLLAENGAEAIEIAQRERPDAILMDVVMPGMNGFQATRKLSKDPATTDIPVVIVSTKGQATDKIWAKRQGAKAYLTKPVDPALLIETLEQVLP